ncbi:MAG: hypothetical protein LBF12_05995 [Christensenellaceae bacterium]|jgi:hypothetical protein|nr:hypothetical protein [Christensenellaceae bacterium]
MNKDPKQIDVSISDRTILNWIDQLTNKSDKESINNFINHAITVGVSELYAKKYGNGQTSNKFSNEPDSFKELETLKMSVDQNAVSLSMCERLLTLLYNLEATKVGGIEVTSEQLENGTLDQLPNYLVAEKNAMLKAEFLHKWRNR